MVGTIDPVVPVPLVGIAARTVMARKRTGSKTTNVAKSAPPVPPPDTQIPRGAATGPALRIDERSRFVLFNLLGKERAYYQVRRFDLHKPAEPISEKSVAHSLII